MECILGISYAAKTNSAFLPPETHLQFSSTKHQELFCHVWDVLQGQFGFGPAIDSGHKHEAAKAVRHRRRAQNSPNPGDSSTDSGEESDSDSDSDTPKQGDAQQSPPRFPSVPDWAAPPGEMPILPVPDVPAPMPADVASKPKEVQEEVARIIGTLAHVANPSDRSLEEVVASVNAVPRSAPSTPRDEHTNLGGSEPFKCFGRDAHGEFFVLPGWEKARSLEKTDRLALTLFPLLSKRSNRMHVYIYVERDRSLLSIELVLITIWCCYTVAVGCCC